MTHIIIFDLSKGTINAKYTRVGPLTRVVFSFSFLNAVESAFWMFILMVCSTRWDQTAMAWKYCRNIATMIVGLAHNVPSPTRWKGSHHVIRNWDSILVFHYKACPALNYVSQRDCEYQWRIFGRETSRTSFSTNRRILSSSSCGKVQWSAPRTMHTPVLSNKLKSHKSASSLLKDIS